MNSSKNIEYIDLMDIAKRLWAYKLPMVAVGIIVALLFSIKVAFFVEDRYVASGILYVTNRSDGSEEVNGEISKSDIETAISMSTTYKEILKTRTFLAEVSEDIGGKYSWKQIKGMMSITNINETELLQISVSANNPKDAYEVANSLINHAPKKLSGIFKQGQAEIVDEPVLPTGAVNKGIAGEAAKGFILGLFLVVAVVVVINLFDTKVRKSEEVAKRYDVSILGEIHQ